MRNHNQEHKLVTEAIKLSEIKITEEFLDTIPNPKKFIDKYIYYRNKVRLNEKFGTNYNPYLTPIILDKDYILIDGYITYLIAKMFGAEKLDVYVQKF